MSRKMFPLALVASTLCSVAHARLMQLWRYDNLMKEADLVVIATPLRGKDVADRFKLDYFDTTFCGVETEFKPESVIKGNMAGKTLTLLHFRLSAPIPNDGSLRINDDPLLVSFRLPVPGGLTKMKEWVDKVDYMLFLKKRADGRYEAVSGQVDPALAIKQLGELDRH
jgi:hypothetical protein